MSVVVKGVDFPKTCGECEFNYNCFCCQITNRHFYYNEEFEPFIQKLDDCPLIELPKHGRLIDADAIDTSYSDPEVIETINTAPTVLEADE